MSSFTHSGQVEIHYTLLDVFCKIHFQEGMNAQNIIRAFVTSFEPEFPAVLQNANYKMKYIEYLCRDDLAVFDYEFRTDILRGHLGSIKDSTIPALQRFHESFVDFALRNLPAFEDTCKRHNVRYDKAEVVDIFSAIEVKVYNGIPKDTI